MNAGMKLPELRKLARHTIVKVGWLDICEEATGDPRESFVVTRHTLGHVWGVKRDKKSGVYVLTMAFTIDEDGPDQSGWICIPVGVIRGVEVIREVKHETPTLP